MNPSLRFILLTFFMPGMPEISCSLYFDCARGRGNVSRFTLRAANGNWLVVREEKKMNSTAWLNILKAYFQIGKFSVFRIFPVSHCLNACVYIYTSARVYFEEWNRIDDGSSYPACTDTGAGRGTDFGVGDWNLIRVPRLRNKYLISDVGFEFVTSMFSTAWGFLPKKEKRVYWRL